MQTRPTILSPVTAARRGFSLIELLTAVSIMVLIIFALYEMFAQTQKALRANLAQSDVLESGRAASEMMGRELAQMTPCNQGLTVNFYTGITPIPPMKLLDVAQDPSQPPLRTNMLEEFFFLTRRTNSWVGIGYRVMAADGFGTGVGTLYRYTVSTNYHYLNYTNLLWQFMHATLATNPITGLVNFDRVADGIVHLRLTAYDPDGRRLDWNSTNLYQSSYRVLRQDNAGRRLGLFSLATNGLDANVVLQQARVAATGPYAPIYNETQFSFASNAVPGYVELELGVLEPAAYKQYQSLMVPGASPQVAQNFLARQGAKVHLFRQRIPIRTVQQ
jgi:prepilin-type N-terminal cleavage/methylation domain-containing protein